MQTLAAAIEAARKRKPKARRAAPEHALQVAVVRYLDLALRWPTVWTGLDAGAGKMTRAAAGMRKARGVRPGWPDILVLCPIDDDGTIVLGIELKSGRGRSSPTQELLAVKFADANAHYVVCRSIGEVAQALIDVGIPLHARPA